MERRLLPSPRNKHAPFHVPVTKQIHTLTVSVIVPALNEADNLEKAVRVIISSLPNAVRTYEIIIIDDGSTDKTYQVAEALAKRNNHIRLMRNNKNRGFGFAFRKGLSVAQYAYVTLYPSDNEMSGESLTDLIAHAQDADIIITYNADSQLRSFARRLISKLYVALVNLLFGLHVRYYNGPFICKRVLLQSVPLVSDGVTFLTESKVRLIKKGYSYKEIPFSFLQRKFGKSTAFTLKNVRSTLKTIASLIMDIYIRKKRYLKNSSLL